MNSYNYYTNILDELYEMNKLLETYNLARLHHEVIANLNRPILSTSFNQKSKEKKITLTYTKKLLVLLVYGWIPTKMHIRININFLILLKVTRGGNTLKLTIFLGLIFEISLVCWTWICKPTNLFIEKYPCIGASTKFKQCFLILIQTVSTWFQFISIFLNFFHQILIIFNVKV